MYSGPSVLTLFLQQLFTWTQYEESVNHSEENIWNEVIERQWHPEIFLFGCSLCQWKLSKIQPPKWLEFFRTLEWQTTCTEWWCHWETLANNSVWRIDQHDISAKDDFLSVVTQTHYTTADKLILCTRCIQWFITQKLHHSLSFYGTVDWWHLWIEQVSK